MVSAIAQHLRERNYDDFSMLALMHDALQLHDCIIVQLCT